MNSNQHEAKGGDGMKRITRFAGKWMDGMRTLWGCQAHPLVKIAAVPFMAGVVFLCCVLDLIDGDQQ